MNSGLPSLLDAIFGKQDLASVSLDEMYEVINEFPSFNAAHFLLSKKLKQENDAAYDKESMRTALYFNNPFWLQTLLDEGNNIRHEKRYVTSIYTVKEEVEEEDYPDLDNAAEPALPVKEEEEQMLVKHVHTIEPAATSKDELDDETEEILEEKTASEPVHYDTGFHYREPGPDTVSSFDELMSKYNIEPVEPVNETPAAHVQEFSADTPAEPEHASDGQTEVNTMNGPRADPYVVLENEFHEEGFSEPDYESYEDAGFKPDAYIQEIISDSNNDQFEIREEVVNDYGIFEEVMVKKSGQNPETFDRPVEQVPVETEEIKTEIIPAGNAVIVENQIPEDTPDKTDEHDYDAFDRPFENNEPEILREPFVIMENSVEDEVTEADNTEEQAMDSGETGDGNNGKMRQLSDLFDEQKKYLSAFNAKNAESIVFTPYHMVDYFASQGIKLVLEDNPVDNFGKHLKSFTDWLKVMKKLPEKPSSEKTDEKEAERIRHFAAHSIQERDILTESMAEVLAKQGMYENAIALYQKLSLIYPPKSAYFASRIEQLKASLP